VYNLDAIIEVGYRVNPYEATQFRIWATQTLKEFIIKGFVMDDARLDWVCLPFIICIVFQNYTYILVVIDTF